MYKYTSSTQVVQVSLAELIYCLVFFFFQQYCQLVSSYLGVASICYSIERIEHTLFFFFWHCPTEDHEYICIYYVAIQYVGLRQSENTRKQLEVGPIFNKKQVLSLLFGFSFFIVLVNMLYMIIMLYDEAICLSVQPHLVSALSTIVTLEDAFLCVCVCVCVTWKRACLIRSTS